MSRSVLIIEDDKRIADWVKIYFERAGFLAEIAHNGKTGLEQARSLTPDLIVLDLRHGWDGCVPAFAPGIRCAHHYTDG